VNAKYAPWAENWQVSASSLKGRHEVKEEEEQCVARLLDLAQRQGMQRATANATRSACTPPFLGCTCASSDSTNIGDSSLHLLPRL